ncbi:hypothetical protein CHLNCDRAFT_143078 [Chlorella variabilis]|uniref:Protein DETOXIFICATION n=1 Tax=Chlorella variabilis TaxID=554065 RepID=E1Z9E5_CHLVA|nr:hypothetical protein CHLNCDRAFT_143078 [Chlorella variabilis]EFN57503.1 hypothetical protein CHLNCDRAFT_143078 [Chlorella variabilis]|eukprot:XP_005849605.1 hypothetical protein CHLNCDRAFT_143078 [Chlorella variabilis]
MSVCHALSSVKAIVGVSIPAIVLNAAPPITVAVQTALLGRYAATSSLAAFAAVGLCVGFVCRVFNFLVDGVSSKVGRCVGSRAWAQLAAHVALSLRWSLALGAAAVPLLLAARAPLCSTVLALGEDVQAEAAGYWLLRTLLVPVQMAAMAAAGVLQGFGRVRVNAALTSVAALLEMGGSAAVLLWPARQPAPPTAAPASTSASGLLAVGCVTCACQALLAAAALACIVALPPAEARGRVDLLREVLGLSSRWSRKSGSPGSGSGSASQPLLAGRTEEAAAAATAPGGSPIRGGMEAEEVQGTPQQPQKQQGAEQQQQPCSEGGSARLLDAATLEDGRDMFLRSVLLQLTFFLALAAASRLGTAALAAHSIVSQLWVVVSYGVDGFAAAGIVLGSRLFGLARDPHLRADAKRSMERLTRRVLLAGGLSGAAAGLAFQLAAAGTIAAFSADPAVHEALRGGGAWAVLCACQPLNGLLFVFDGLLLATQHFRFIRNYMALGFALVFCRLRRRLPRPGRRGDTAPRP